MKAIFSDIYERNAWVHGSGEGSLPAHTRGYVRFLERFLRDNNVKSVIDFGCGDWQVSRLVNWDGINYLGMDVVESLIQHHLETYQSKNVSFAVTDGVPSTLPAADLIIIKDVLQHWSTQSIVSLMPLVERYKFALITNCVDPEGKTVNDDIVNGGFRYLDLTEPPFSYRMDKVYEFTNSRGSLGFSQKPRWRKIVFLHRGLST